jgi:3-oxoacyl-[acyl-carrier-protein] synthase-3
MQAAFNSSRIAGVAAAVPRRSLDLVHYAPQWGASDVANIIRNTGITHVRIAPDGMTTADLCCAAVAPLLSALDVEAAAIDGVVFVSQTADYIMPATSTVIQHRLGLSRKVAAFDINYGCSGYIYGLLQADMLIQSGMCRSVLVLAGDTTTRLVNPRDRALRMLFGDAGSATLVVQGDARHTYSVRTDGSGATSLIIPAGGARQPRSAETGTEKAGEDGNFRCAENLFMDGIAVLYMALRDVPETIAEATALAGWHDEKPAFYGLHQANRFMIDYLARKLGSTAGSTPFACADVGNTGPASIPVMLAREFPRLCAEQRLSRSALCGFGVGFSVAAMTVPLERTTTLPLIEVDQS